MAVLNVPSWYIVYTKPLREKKVTELLALKNIKHYRPLKRVKSIYSGSMQEPLFASYVFVCITPDDYHRVTMIPDIIGFVYWLSDPVLVRDAEIETIKKFMIFYKDVEIEKIPVSRDSSIAVMYHPAPPLTGSSLSGSANGFVKVRLPSLGYAIKARISRDLIKWTDILQLANYQQLSVPKFAS